MTAAHSDSPSDDNMDDDVRVEPDAILFVEWPDNYPESEIKSVLEAVDEASKDGVAVMGGPCQSRELGRAECPGEVVEMANGGDD